MRAHVLLCLPLLLIAAGACRKQKPVTVPEAAPETVAPAPAPQPDAPEPSDPVAKGLPQDLLELNAYLEAQGLLGDVYFDYDQSALRADTRERLARNAEFLRQHPEYEVTVEGHCDERGTSEYNLALGDRRAHAAVDYLQDLGVARSRLRTVSYGEERPQCAESYEACWQRNRRAHFLVTGQAAAG
jgi:peptidoglycan-associated lipoprotein